MNSLSKIILSVFVLSSELLYGQLNFNHELVVDGDTISVYMSNNLILKGKENNGKPVGEWVEIDSLRGRTSVGYFGEDLNTKKGYWKTTLGDSIVKFEFYLTKSYKEGYVIYSSIENESREVLQEELVSLKLTPKGREVKVYTNKNEDWTQVTKYFKGRVLLREEILNGNTEIQKEYKKNKIITITMVNGKRQRSKEKRSSRLVCENSQHW
jgi:hypothetical protein